MISSGGMSNDFLAMLAAAVASSLLTFTLLAASGWIGGAPAGGLDPLDVVVMLSVVLIWGPAFALVPAGILGYLLERPLSRRLIARPSGGFVEHILIITAASLFLWLMLRIAVVLTGPQTRIFDGLSLFVFGIVGVSSALSWWFLVIDPGRRMRSDGGVP